MKSGLVVQSRRFCRLPDLSSGWIELDFMETKKKGYVYILKDKTGRFYVGSTDNLERRLKQHKNGHTQTTRNMNDFEIALNQEYESLNLARKIETKIKKLKRKDYIEKIINDGYIRITI